MLEPLDVVLGFLNVVVDRDDAYVGIKCAGGLGCHLRVARRLGINIFTQATSVLTNALLCFTSFFLNRN